MTLLQSTRVDGGSPRSATLVALQLGLVALLVFASARIVVPFISVLLWSMILAVMLYPLHLRLSRRLGNRWSAVLIGLVSVALVLVPIILLAASLASSLSALVEGVQNHTLAIPPPPARLATLPVVGQRLTEAWSLAATSFPAALAKYGPTLREPLAGLAATAAGLVAAELSFVLAFGIAAVLIAYGKSVSGFAHRLLQVVSGDRARGARIVALITATIRGVAVGVVGVAAIQTAFLAVGFFAIGLPFPGILTLIALLLGVIQIPATLMTIPVIAYVFATEATTPAIIFAVWTLVAGLSDNVLKPLMLGRGLEAPMPVILIGVIGGMIVDGLLGLFVGPVILAVSYVLFVEWMRTQTGEGSPPLDTSAT